MIRERCRSVVHGLGLMMRSRVGAVPGPAVLLGGAVSTDGAADGSADDPAHAAMTSDNSTTLAAPVGRRRTVGRAAATTRITPRDHRRRDRGARDVREG